MLRVEKNNNNNNAQKEDFEVLYGVTEWHGSESYLSNFKTIHKKFNFKEHLRVLVRIEWFCIRRLEKFHSWKGCTLKTDLGPRVWERVSMSQAVLVWHLIG